MAYQLSMKMSDTLEQQIMMQKNDFRIHRKSSQPPRDPDLRGCNSITNDSLPI